MVINTLTQISVVNSIIEVNLRSKEQTERDNYDKLEKPNEILERLGYLVNKPKKEYILHNGLKIKSRRLSTIKLYQCEKVLAYDTETYHGKCKLIASNIGKYILNPTFYQTLKFLFYLANKTKIYRFFYNLDFDITSILKLWSSNINVLKKRIIRKIKWLKNGIEVKYKEFLIKWIKGRMFTIKHITRRNSVVFTDIFNFFHLGLGKSSEIYLKDIKIDDIDGNLLNTSLNYWNKREKDIIKYCIQDCILTKRLGKLLIESIEKVGLPLPKYIVSSASLSKQYFRHNGFIPKVSHIPKILLQISYDCYFGGRFEMFKRGTFDNNLYLYDIVSQYPYFIKDLLSLRDGVWKQSNLFPKNQCYGYFKAKVDIPKNYLIPTIPISHKGINKFPNGIIEKWFTWYDLDLIRDFIIEIKDGFIFYESALCNSNPKNNHKPFKEKIEWLFEKKKELKGKSQLDYNLVKLCMNALYGCFIEKHKNYNKDGTFELNSGILFNSVYASQITAFGRWSVIKDIPRENYKNIIAIHTDSILTDIPMNKFLDIGKELGQWNLENKGKGLILNTGMYQIGNIVKTRGIPKKFIKDWFEFCKKNKIYKKKSFIITHMRKLAEGLIRDKNLSNVNTMIDDIRSVNCNSDSKRDWLRDFRSFNDVLTSNIDSLPYYCYNDIVNLKPNPLCVAYRFEK